MSQTTELLWEEISRAIQVLDFEQTYRTHWEQNNCVFFAQFLPSAVIEYYLLPAIERLRAEVHRTYIPPHKKGGSVSSDTLVKKTPMFLDLYRSLAFIAFMSRLVSAMVTSCPDDDPHACAL